MYITVKGTLTYDRLAGQGKPVEVVLHSLPEKCPHCHKSIGPIPIHAVFQNRKWAVLLVCPDNNCNESFLAYYGIGAGTQSVGGYLDRTSIGTFSAKVFPDEITEISSAFATIYNEALSAETMNLFEICGMGYRKALEFLIKDYLIEKFPENKEVIEKKMLGKCIEDHVTDANIKSVAKRATWLGNDETHYVRKWEGKNLTDLKKLIDLTLHWISAEVLTASFSEDMPD